MVCYILNQIISPQVLQQVIQLMAKVVLSIFTLIILNQISDLSFIYTILACTSKIFS